MRETIEGLGVGGGLFIGWSRWQVYSNTLRIYPSRPILHVSDRRESIRPPIQKKSRITRSARRARYSYLSLLFFQTFFTTQKIIICLLNKGGFGLEGDGCSCSGCAGARFTPRCQGGGGLW